MNDKNKKMKKIISLILLGGMFCNAGIFAQEESAESPESEDSNVSFSAQAATANSSSGWLHENDGKKHPLVAIGGMLFFNLGLSSYNRWCLGSAWAQTGWDEWDHFWEREMKYDRDWYWTNFVLHPYQGSLYYMSARGSNLNYFESFAVTLLGSSIWEYLCETNAPSTNDMFYTSVGSFAVGEMLYRLSLEADEVSSLLGFAINPMRLWTQGWTRQKPLGTTGNIHELSVKIGGGTARTHTDIDGFSRSLYKQNEVFPVYGSAMICVVYNDPYGHDSNTPYEQFELNFGGSAGIGSGEGADCAYSDLDEKLMYNIRIESNGMLFARAPRFSENVDTTLGLVMEYNFDWHQFYELTALGPGLAIKQRVRFNSSNFEWQLHGAWNAMGTTDYYYYHRKLGVITKDDGVSRNYNMTTGPMAILKMRYITENGSSLNLGFQGYAMYNFYDQVQDNLPGYSTGWEWIGIANVSAELAVSKKIRVGIGDELYMKQSFYKRMPDLFQFVNSASAFMRVQLK